MNRYYYDLHLHSCLSPCADDDMTVNNIAGMASLKGLQLVALTDHNTLGNVPAFWQACKGNGLIPIAGAEVTTEEEIHMVCLFETLDAGMAFDAALQPHRAQIRNRTEIFGNQLLLDADDNVLGTDDLLLPVATDLSLDKLVQLAESFGGFVFPAHIDRPANGILGVLGALPESPYFSCVELSDSTKAEELAGVIAGRKTLFDSDAHNLWTINEAENAVFLDDEPYSSDFVRKQFFRYLRSET